MLKTPLVISLCIFISLAGYSQELSHKQYTVKDGLPGSVVYHTLQDRKGFIWFATNQGVSRFDGHTFKNFFKEDGLPDNEILKMYLDRYDNIWFISFLGIPSVWHNEKIYSFPDCSSVISVIEDFNSDSILLTSYSNVDPVPSGGFYSSANTSGHWLFQKHIQKEEGPLYINSILQGSSASKVNFSFSLPDKENYELQVTRQNDARRFRYRRNIKDPYEIPYTRYTRYALTPDNLSIVFSGDSLYIGGNTGVKGLVALKDLNLQPIDVSYLYPENDSVLWLCTRKKGLMRITNWRKINKQISYYFPKAYCTSIIKDREGGYWVTTHNDGVYYIPEHDFYYVPSLARENAKDIKVLCPYTSNSLLAGSTDGSISIVNLVNFSSTPIAKWNNNNKNNRVLDIRLLDRERILVASDYGAFLWHGDEPGKSVWPMNGVKSLAVMSDTSIIVASAAGMHIHNVPTGRMRLIMTKRATWVDGAYGKYYWGTLTGLYEYANNTVKDLGKSFPSLRGIINHINISPDSSLWVSTQQGLVILKNNRSTVISKKEGLLSDNCKHVLFKNDIAWISTDRGISRMTWHWNANELKYTLAEITDNDGLLSNDVNQCTIAGNYIWAGTALGLCAFSENNVAHITEQPLLNIIGITAGDSKKAYDDKVQINYLKNKLLITLSGISYRSGKDIHYEYRIRDIDSNWNVASSNQLEFSTLPFGTHIFEARAIDRWGKKSETKAFAFTVIPPFWKTTWFIIFTYLITALLIGLIAWAIYWDRKRKLNKEHRLEKKVYELEIMALKAQMNPHFIFNCLSSIQHYIIRADTEKANLYLHKFSTLIRNTLELSSRVDITLEEELKLLNLYLELERLRMGDRMEYRITVEKGILPAVIRIPSMIIQPYVENSIRHGISPLQDRRGMISIDFKIESGYLACTIDDNGIGIAASTAAKNLNDLSHRSMGTGITSSRIITINAVQENKLRVWVTDKTEQGLGKGTDVKLLFRI